MKLIRNSVLLFLIFFPTFAKLFHIRSSPTNLTNLTYFQLREKFVNEEHARTVGGSVYLHSYEKRVNDILMGIKRNELLTGTHTPETYAPALHFFKAKKFIDNSLVYKFLQKMPKGAILHGHNSAMVTSQWLIKNITYRSDLLKCTNLNGDLILSFRKIEKHNCRDYVRVIEERSKSPSHIDYDYTLEKSLNLYHPNPEAEYQTSNSVWKRFENIFSTISDMITYSEVFYDFHRQLLTEMYEDGIFYVEYRTSFSKVYDRTGTEWNRLKVAREMLRISEDFRQGHANFLGLKTIFAIKRNIALEKLQIEINDFKALHFQMPDFVIGFDLVGQEDLGEPLSKFIDQLLQLPNTAKFFFHAGETNHYGSSIDRNLIDAILLKTYRIGHGFALSKHPILRNLIKEKDICIEINPISNQVLNLVTDLRNHPASIYISENLPIIISSDDPGFWNAKGLSYDFYYALMSLAPNDAGLGFLKQIVWNSLRYSGLSQSERTRGAKILRDEWMRFLNQIIKEWEESVKYKSD